MNKHIRRLIKNEKDMTALVWQKYKDQLTGEYAAANNHVKSDYENHSIREYNRRIKHYGLNTGLFITPFNAGFSYKP